MMHKAWSSIEEVLFCFARSSVQFQGRTALKIVEFDPDWAFPDCNSSLKSPMATKWCTKLETAKERWPIVFQGHPSNFKVTRYKTSPILTQIGHFRTIGRSQLSNPSDLPCLAATKQLYERYFLSVCLSHLFDYVPIIVSSRNFQELLPMTEVMSMQKVKVIGERSRSQRSQPNLTVSGLLLQFEFTYDDEIMHMAWWYLGEVPNCFSRSSVKFQGHTALKSVEFDPDWAFPDCNSSLNPPMATKWCTKLEVVKRTEDVPYCFSRSSVKFQGHTALKSVKFHPDWAFPDCNSSLNPPMATKCCTKLEAA